MIIGSSRQTAHFAALGLLAAAFSVVVDLPASGSNETRSSAVLKASISDVAWIAGRWVKDADKDRLEETWSVPRGDCMIGMFRWLKEGKVFIYELLTIREEEQTLVFRFRHFGNDMTSWEPKDKPLTYRLVTLSENEAVFENPSSDSHRRYSFSRPDPDTLVVQVGAFRDGKVSSTEFVLHRE